MTADCPNCAALTVEVQRLTRELDEARADRQLQDTSGALDSIVGAHLIATAMNGFGITAE